MGDGLLPIISNIYTIVIKIFVQWFGNLWVPRKKKKAFPVWLESNSWLFGFVGLFGATHFAFQVAWRSRKKIIVSAWNWKQLWMFFCNFNAGYTGPISIVWLQPCQHSRTLGEWHDSSVVTNVVPSDSFWCEFETPTGQRFKRPDFGSFCLIWSDPVHVASTDCRLLICGESTCYLCPSCLLCDLYSCSICLFHFIF